MKNSHLSWELCSTCSLKANKSKLRRLPCKVWRMSEKKRFRSQMITKGRRKTLRKHWSILFLVKKAWARPNRLSWNKWDWTSLKMTQFTLCKDFQWPKWPKYTTSCWMYWMTERELSNEDWRRRSSSKDLTSRLFINHKTLNKIRRAFRMF